MAQELPGGFGIYMKHALIGGLIGAVLSSIPFLKMLNACFCLLVMVGAGAGMSMFFSENPSAGMRDGNAAMFGGVSGAVAGGVSSLLSIGLSFVWIGFANPLGGYLGFGGGSFIVAAIFGLLISVIICAIFGALGGFLALQVMFKAKRVQ